MMQTQNNRFALPDQQPNNPNGGQFFTKNNEPIPLEILTLFEQQRENFPLMIDVSHKQQLHPGSFFLPQTIKDLDHEFTYNTQFTIDTKAYTDMIGMYSFVLTGDSSTFFDQVINMIIRNRTASEASLVVGRSGLDDFTFVNHTETMKYLQNNRHLVALYVFVMIDMLFFKRK